MGGARVLGVVGTKNVARPKSIRSHLVDFRSNVNYEEKKNYPGLKNSFDDIHQAKMHNYPFKFFHFSFQSYNFGFCHFSLLNFNPSQLSLLLMC